jgi:hypothetical protein
MDLASIIIVYAGAMCRGGDVAVKRDSEYKHHRLVLVVELRRFYRWCVLHIYA